MAWGRMRSGVEREAPETRVPAAGEGDGISERVLKFLTSLPISHSVHEWSTAFRATLQEFFTEIDRVSMSVNVGCDLIDPATYQPYIMVSQHVQAAATKLGSIVNNTAYGVGEHGVRALAMLRNNNFSFDRYHAPNVYEFFYQQGGYLGVIILWREARKTPFSPRTLTLFENLRPLWIYIISDFVARYQAANPVVVDFEKLLERFKLSTQERRVIILLLCGMSHDEISDTLSSTLSIRTHNRA